MRQMSVSVAETASAAVGVAPDHDAVEVPSSFRGKRMRDPAVQRRERGDCGSVVRIVTKHDEETHCITTRGREDGSTETGGQLAGSDDGVNAGGRLDRGLEARQRRCLTGNARPPEEQRRGSDDPWTETRGRSSGGLTGRAAGWQPAHDVCAKTCMNEPARAEQQRRAAESGRDNGGPPPAEQPCHDTPASAGVGSRGARDSAARRQARPESGPAEYPDNRGHERHGHEPGDHDGNSHPGPHGVKEIEVRGDERDGPGRHGERGSDHQRDNT